MPPPYKITGPKTAKMTYAFAHGAGVGMDSDFMDYFAEALGKAGIRVVRFEFPYMQKRRDDGKKRPPDRAPVLMETWGEVIDDLGRENLVIGGKSMGGRIASMIAAEREAEGAPVAGCVFLGYPFHAPGKPKNVRADHLAGIKTPCLILQGDRDPFGTKEEIAGYKLGKAVKLHYMPDGEHSFKPRKASGRTEEQNWAEAVETMAGFIQKLS